MLYPPTILGDLDPLLPLFGQVVAGSCLLLDSCSVSLLFPPANDEEQLWHVAACSAEIDGFSGSRQGVLDESETWAQGVGGRRIAQRYVGEYSVPHDIMHVNLIVLSVVRWPRCALLPLHIEL